MTSNIINNNNNNNIDFDIDTTYTNGQFPKLRDYQEALFREACDKNLIICQATGTGKTLIAVRLILAKLPETIGEFPGDARRTIFLAPTKDLVKQQFSVIQKHLPKANVCCLTGADGVDFFVPHKWDKYFKCNQILVMTPAVLERAISKGAINMDNLNLLIFDEAHHAMKKKNKVSGHPYRTLMEFYKNLKPTQQKPRILGMTASVVNAQSKSTELDNSLQKIQNIYDAEIRSRDVGEFCNEAKVIVINYHNQDHSSDWAIDFDFNQHLTFASNDFELNRTFSQLLAKIDSTLYEMGPWFALQAIQLYRKSLDNLPYQLGLSFGLVLDLFKNRIDLRHPMSILALNKISSKLDKLLRVLVHMKDDLHCFVFVKERTDANLIYRWLRHLAQTYDNFSFLKVGFNCGSIKKDIIRFDEPTKNFKQQSDAGLLNVLVTTAVNEEGIDVPALNLVIRYDFPMTNRAFCQSKGRARHRISQYVLMIDPTNDQEKKLLQEFLEFENLLNQKLLTETEWNVGSGQIDYDDIGEMFHTGAATLLERDAISILQTYLAKLPTDFFTQTRANFIEFSWELTPTWSSQQSMIMDNFGISGSLPKIPMGQQFIFFYIFIFPANCAASGIVHGKLRNSKKAAKHSCAFKACKLLLESGELDQNLNVVEETNLLRKHAEELNLKVNNCQQEMVPAICVQYPCLKANYFTGSIFSEPSRFIDIGETYYQYSIDFDCCNSVQPSGGGGGEKSRCPLYEKIQICFNSSSFCLGLLLKGVRLPTTIIESMINYKMVRVQFKVRYNYAIELKYGERTEQIKRFNDHLFETMFWRVNQLHNKHFLNFMLVPLAKNDDPLQCSVTIDYKLLEDFHEYRNRFECFRIAKMNLDMAPLDDNTIFETFFQPDSLFTCLYQATSSVENIFYLKNVGSKYPTSTLEPNTPETFNDYYDRKYNFQIVRQQTPLVNAGNCKIFAKSWNVVPNQTAMATASAESATTLNGQKGQNGHLLFPVEFTIRYPLNRTQLAMISSFPSLFYRLEQYLIAFKLMRTLSLQITNLKLDFDPQLSFWSLLSDQSLPMETKEIETKLKNISIEQLNYGETFNSRFFTENITEFIHTRLDTFDFVKCPNPWHVVRALTPKKANDIWNLERLETIGDSFLKMSTCVYLYHQYRSYDEGKLITLKDAIVCNDNLYRLALEHELPSFMFAKSLLLFNQEQRKTIDELFEMQQNSGMGFLEKPKFKQDLKHKDIADCVEALIGTFLIHGSAGSAVQFLQWIGIRAFDPAEAKVVDPVQIHQEKQQAQLEELKKIPELDRKMDLSEVIDFPLLIQQVYQKDMLSQVEQIVDYQFKQKYYLIQAFTHPSFGNGTVDSSNKISQLQSISCYQRLEFVGDAILDYLITHHIYSSKHSLSPFQITSLRSALVNNVFFASIVVKYDLHKFLRYSSQSLKVAIESFSEKYSKKSINELGAMLEDFEKDSNQDESSDSDQQFIDECEIPKALADIFESLIGAIFVDNGYSLDQIWKIVYRMIKPEIDYLLENIPMMPLALLQKEFLDKYTYSAIKLENQKMSIELTIEEKKFIGVGRNKKQCKLSAAKRALKYFGKTRFTL